MVTSSGQLWKEWDGEYKRLKWGFSSERWCSPSGSGGGAQRRTAAALQLEGAAPIGRSSCEEATRQNQNQLEGSYTPSRQGTSWDPSGTSLSPDKRREKGIPNETECVLSWLVLKYLVQSHVWFQLYSNLQMKSNIIIIICRNSFNVFVLQPRRWRRWVNAPLKWRQARPLNSLKGSDWDASLLRSGAFAPPPPLLSCGA